MKNKKNRVSGIVFSTEGGKMCPKCRKPVAHCVCRKTSTSQQKTGDGIVRVSRETKGRKGKGVSLITGVPLSEYDLKDLAKELKQKCGSGGTVKNGVIEIQGDHRDLLVKTLTERGYTVKRSGG